MSGGWSKRRQLCSRAQSLEYAQRAARSKEILGVNTRFLWRDSSSTRSRRVDVIRTTTPVWTQTTPPAFPDIHLGRVGSVRS
jgi:hypothetical protein